MEPPDPVTDVALLVVVFRSGVISGAFSTFTSDALDPPPTEPHTCSATALLGACYPSDTDFEMELPSLRINLLFFLGGGGEQPCLKPAPDVYGW
jgi:hypothetical protein